MDKSDAIKRLRNLLRKEQEFQEKKWFSNDVSIKQLRKEGVVIHPIKVLRKRFGYADYPVFSFNFSHDINTNLFKGGVPIALFSEENDKLCTGNILYINGNNGEVALFSNDFPDWLEEQKVGIKLIPDSRSFDLMHGVLKKIDKLEDKILTSNFEYLHGIKPLPEVKVNDVKKYYNTELNDSQKEAVRNITGGNRIQLLHGPPGTGKTTTLIEAAIQLIKSGKKIVVAAPSNAAVDHFALTLIKSKVKVFRFGNTIKVNEEVWNYTPEGILSQPEYAKSLKKLKIQAEEYRKLSTQYKRNFGKEEREQRNLLFKEYKALRAEIKNTSNFILEKSINEAQVILGTPVGLRDNLLSEEDFDYIFIDEAAQCIEPMAWVAIQMAGNIVLAGDPYQLPPTVIDPVAEKEGLNISILERGFKTKISTLLLNIQYRMPPTIADFSSNYFYEGKIKSHKNDRDDVDHLTFFDTAGANFSELQDETSTSISNLDELNFIEKMFPEWSEKYNDIVFISPYAGQVRLAKSKLEPIRCSTIDSFQGQEADLVIISLVRSNDSGNIGFLKDYRRMNVAMTRAKEHLIIIGDSATLGNDTFYSSFLNYVEERGSYKSVWG